MHWVIRCALLASLPHYVWIHEHTVSIGALGLEQLFRVPPSGSLSEGRNLEAREKMVIATLALLANLIFVSRDFVHGCTRTPTLCTSARGSPDRLFAPAHTEPEFCAWVHTMLPDFVHGLRRMLETSFWIAVDLCVVAHGKLID